MDRAITLHIGQTPELVESANLDADRAKQLLDLETLRESGAAVRDSKLVLKGRGAIDAFLIDPHCVAASRIVSALMQISPNATTAENLGEHLSIENAEIDDALDVLQALGAVETMPRGEGRIARLHSRLRHRVGEIPVVGLS